MVEVKFNSYIITPHYYTSHAYIHYFCINFQHTKNSNVKKPYSWLFHIIKICILEYIEKNSRNKITIYFIIFWYYKKFTQQYKHRIQCKKLCFYVLLKTWTKIIIESHVLLKKSKTTIKIYGIFKTKFVVFYYKYL
jgi:hypothetical protein